MEESQHQLQAASDRMSSLNCLDIYARVFIKDGNDKFIHMLVDKEYTSFKFGFASSCPWQTSSFDVKL